MRTEFFEVSEKLSKKILEIDLKKIELSSIAERISVLQSTDDDVSEVNKARTKSRNLMREIAELQHSVRMFQAEIEALKAGME